MTDRTPTANRPDAKPIDVAAESLHRQLRDLGQRAREHHPPALQRLAQLRRARGQRFGASTEASAALVTMVSDSLSELSQDQQDDLMLAAWLVAQYRPEVGHAADAAGNYLRPGFGRDFAAAARAAGAGAVSPGAERLMKRILDARREDLPRHLPRALSQFRGTSASLDVAQLVLDLDRWSAADRRVQRRWALQFWTPQSTPQNDDPKEDQ